MTVALLVGACGDEQAAAPGGPDDHATSTSASGDDQPDGVVGEIRMTTTGGVAGGYESIVILADGTVLSSDDPDSSPAVTGRSMDPGELAALQDAVSSPEFRSLEPTYVPPRRCCDQHTYEVSAQVGDRTIASTTADGVEAPAVLDDVVSRLRDAAADG